MSSKNIFDFGKEFMSRSDVSQNLPTLMNSAGELEQNINFHWRDLRHRLGRVEKIIFCYWLEAVSAGCVQVNSFDQFHVVEEGTESHEVRKAYFVSCGHLKEVRRCVTDTT